MRHPEKENFYRVIRRDDPSHVTYPIPSRGGTYRGAGPADTRPSPETMEWRDEWGVRWVDKAGEVFPYGPAVDSIEEVEDIPRPDPDRPDRLDDFKETARKLDREKYVLGCVHRYFLYEKVINILGPEEFGAAMLLAPEKAHRALDIIMEFELGIAERFCEVGVDSVCFCDDYGHQDRLAMSPECWREFFKPRLKKAVGFYRDRLGLQVVVSLHCCGHVMPILEDFVEVGLDIIDPVQTTANDHAEMRARTSGTLALCGGIDGQQLLPFAEPEEVRRTVFEKLDLLWENGGYFPAAEKRVGVPPENFEAMDRAIRDWSRSNVQDGAG